MRGEGYLTTNSNIAWPFDENDPALDRRVSCMFADGSALLYPQESGFDVFVSDVSAGRGVVRFSVCKCGPSADGSNDCDSVVVEAVLTDGPYTTVAAPWFFFVIDNDEAARNDGSSWPGRSFRLDAAACGAEAERVRSLSLYRRDQYGVLDPIALGIRGDVIVRAGYNAYVGTDPEEGGLVASRTDGEAMNGVVVSAVAGIGLGTVPCNESNDSNDYYSDDDPGSVRPDAEGNVVIESDQCYQVSPDEHRVQLTPHGEGVVHVLLTGRCTACCQCDDFVKVNDRLADSSESVLAAYGDLMYSRSLYERQAELWNRDLYKVDEDDFVARVIVMTQNYTVPDASHAVSMTDKVKGSIDRAQAVVSLKNLSPVDATVSVSLRMSPQSIVLANVIVPNGGGGTWTRASSSMVVCDGKFVDSDIPIPAGSGVTIRVYGSQPDTTTPSDTCRVTGSARFKWLERVDCPDPSNDVEDGFGSNDANMCFEEKYVVKSLNARQGGMA